MLPRIHLVGFWSAIAFLTVLGLGLVVFAGFVPPPKPTATAADIAAFYRDHANGVLFGMVLMIIGSGFYLPWTVTLSAMIRRMEGETTFLSQCQLIGGLFASLTFFFPAAIFGVAAYRMERSPELIQLINDAGWILFIVAPIPPFIVQFLPLAAAILTDNRKTPLLPRWFGFATLWYIVLFSLAMAGFFFKTGPFAWNGLITFYVPVVGFGIWASVLLVFTYKLIARSTPPGQVA